MATVTIEIDVDGDGNVTVTPNPAAVSDGDVVRWHVNSNAHGSGALTVGLPPDAGSPFGNEDNLLQTGVEAPRRCNLLEPATEPIAWPSGSTSYSYTVEFTGNPVQSTVSGRLVKRAGPEAEITPFPDDVRAVYLVPANPPVGRGRRFTWYPKIYPLPWWKRWRRRYWPFWGHPKSCCCCCCCGQPGGQPPIVPPPPATVAAPTIVLSQGMLAIGGQFYLLITPQGDRCQFVVQWQASGGVGQLTVDLDVRDPGATAFRRLASGLGPSDQYVFVGQRATYLFRATVTDARGQSTFDTLTVTCP